MEGAEFDRKQDRDVTLAGELKAILPELEKPLGQGGAGRFRLETPKP